MITGTDKSIPDRLPPHDCEAEPAPDYNPAGWFRAMRTPDAWELVTQAPNAFILGYIIASRAQYRDGFNRHSLEVGEALLGDYANYGMTRQQYRTATRQLAEWHFVTFKTTNRGTIAKLMDTRLFSVLRIEANQQNNQRLTNKQPAANHYQERKNGRTEDLQSESRIVGPRYEKAPGQERQVRPLGDVISNAVNPVGAPTTTGDWGGMNLREKALLILSPKEIGNRPDWIRRIENAPEDLEEIMDKMHADIQEGKVIKNRGAYAETLWKASRINGTNRP